MSADHAVPDADALPGVLRPEPALPQARAVVVGAMAEEIRPYLEAATTVGPVRELGVGEMRLAEFGGVPALLVRCGVGLVNAASALTEALLLTGPVPAVSTGSAGGLGADVEVGDVVLGETYAYTQADATAFTQNVRGQVPGMPAVFESGAALLAAARAQRLEHGRLLSGLMISGDAFVTAHHALEARAVFPEALTVDMETTALAHVARTRGAPFLSVRGISDLALPDYDDGEHAESFSLGLQGAAERSASVVLGVLSTLG
ncbi:5'-methylthioadenosine/S-adenosylhomocysteine nucleosidase [Bogoriella caseilytica]|uniref:adenosylhomocysteine nucleosidase n=1 Tax=Bogoriella caseilytica TaxID=56055 RepID=A0A3N2BCA4_9MICO|nr:5'-methylthioadenosine/S-adenosylhomocysteine nucleosidase [Bogoriella caseilytica]ROR72891.1 adenosylhomocysteine nucleosidase [Bogoriella caseilytica]